jgi:hypothetical protein
MSSVAQNKTGEDQSSKVAAGEGVEIRGIEPLTS